MPQTRFSTEIQSHAVVCDFYETERRRCRKTLNVAFFCTFPFILCCFNTFISLLPFHTIGNDVRLVGRAEAEVVKGEQCVAPVRCQVCQQFQGSGHPKDTLLAVLRE